MLSLLLQHNTFSYLQILEGLQSVVVGTESRP